MTLALAGRAEEALLEALDALARAREADDAKAVGACMALLAKLYAAAGTTGEAAALRESAGVATECLRRRALYLGVDVGTASVRAGLFDARGAMHGIGDAAPSRLDRPREDFVEQS